MKIGHEPSADIVARCLALADNMPMNRYLFSLSKYGLELSLVSPRVSAILIRVCYRVLVGFDIVYAKHDEKFVCDVKKKV